MEKRIAILFFLLLTSAIVLCAALIGWLLLRQAAEPASFSDAQLICSGVRHAVF